MKIKLRFLFFVFNFVLVISSLAGPDRRISQRALPRVVATPYGSLLVRIADDIPKNESEIHQGQEPGTLVYENQNGIIKRKLTMEALDVIKDIVGEEAAENVEAAHQKGGYPGVTDYFKKKAVLEVVGADNVENKLKDYVKDPTPKNGERMIEDALVEEKLIPPGLVDTGRTGRDLIQIVSNTENLGLGPEDISPSLVEDMDNVKRHRMTLKDLIEKYRNMAKKIPAPDGEGPSGPTRPRKPGMSPPRDQEDPNKRLPRYDSHDGQPNQQKPKPRNSPGPSDNGKEKPGGSSADTGHGRSANSSPQESEGKTVYTVVSITHDDNTGDTEVIWSRSGGNDGKDGTYKTVYDKDKNYNVYDSEGAYLYSGTGTPPADSSVGSSTTTVNCVGKENCEAVVAINDNNSSGTNSPEYTPVDEGTPLPPAIEESLKNLTKIFRAYSALAHPKGDSRCGTAGMTPLHARFTTFYEAWTLALFTQSMKVKFIGNPGRIDSTPRPKNPDRKSPGYNTSNGGAVDPDDNIP